MPHITISKDNNIATITLNRGKVNAINSELVQEFDAALKELAGDDKVRGIILTGNGNFFSFGLDVPELYPLSREDMTEFLQGFTKLLRSMFLFPKPIVAAINGHAIAGGCMLASACDYRIMVTGKPRIGLNEVRIGASVFAGSVEMLRCAVGHRNAETILFDGGMYSAERAGELGLLDKVTTDDKLMTDATEAARRLASGSSRAFGSIKGLLHNPVAAEFEKREQAAIAEFVDIWYSPETRELLKSVVIR